MYRLLLAATLVALAGCSGAGTGIPASPAPQAVARHAASGAEAPGDSASALPGDSASALPGAQLACPPSSTLGVASCTLAINITIAPNGNPQAPLGQIAGYHPTDLQTAYALPLSRGGVVAIVDAYDDATAESDLAVYRAAFSLPSCTSANGCFRKLGESGANTLPAPNAAWSQEIALDLDMVSAGCPACTIVLVEANSSSIDDLGAAVDVAAAQAPAAISNSYYASEWSNEQNEDVHYRHPGIALTASAGDAGTPSYPAVSPFVTAVGGTSLHASAGSFSETAWSYGGQGCSAYVAAPRWQRGPCTSRAAVDVAAVADPQTGVAFFCTTSGGWLVAGGTSVGAPLLAAAYALSGNPAAPGFSYQHPSAFHDVPPTGIDLVTGLGSPKGTSGL
ncbi:MAG: peptidase S8 [Vulcanimicrobiaceae bacterium]